MSRSDVCSIRPHTARKRWLWERSHLSQRSKEISGVRAGLAPSGAGKRAGAVPFTRVREQAARELYSQCAPAPPPPPPSWPTLGSRPSVPLHSEPAPPLHGGVGGTQTLPGCSQT